MLICYNINSEIDFESLAEKFAGLLLCQKEEFMPHKPKQGCAYPNCPKLTNGRYCEEHQRLIAKQYNRFTRAVDVNKKYGRAWKKFVTAMCRHTRCVSNALNRAEQHLSRRFTTLSHFQEAVHIVQII